MTVLTILPTSDVTKEWSRSTGTNSYTLVDDNHVTTDYIYGPTGAEATKTERYGMADHTAEAGTISNVRVVGYCKRVQQGAETNAWIKLGVKIGATDYGLTQQTLTTSYIDYYQNFAVNPATTNAWSWAEVDALIGVIAGHIYYTDVENSSQPFCASFWIEVTYTSGWANITQVKGIASASIAEKKGIAVASISQCKGIAV